jgi:uncharacterized protein YbaR (Trm112 family)
LSEGIDAIQFDARAKSRSLPAPEILNMPIDSELIEILVCPETRQPVSLAPPETLARINADIDAGRLRNRGGETVEKHVEEGLLREDGHILYIIDDSIPIMLIDQSIELN